MPSTGVLGHFDTWKRLGTITNASIGFSRDWTFGPAIAVGCGCYSGGVVASAGGREKKECKNKHE